MASRVAELDSEGVYLGMSLEEFGVKVSAVRAQPDQGVDVMPRESLRESIEHLRGELATGEPLSAAERARLERVLGDISGVLDREGEPAEPESDLLADLREFAEGFEESHPKLALVLGRVMDSLSQLGI